MIVAVIVCAVLLFAAIVWLTALALGGEQPQGRHVLGGERVPALQGEADPFADPDAGTDPDKAADQYLTELRGTREPETAAMPVPVLTAPLPAAGALEPLEPLSPSPPDRRERTVIPAGALPSWEPPVSRGTLESLRDALLAKTWPGPDPAEAAPPEPASEPEPGPAESDWLTTSAVNAFAPVMLLGDVGKYVDREFAPAEEAVRALIAEHLGSEEKTDFAGRSLAGLPEDEWDFSAAVVLNGNGGSA